MNENGGNGNFTRNNLIYRSTDGGNTWTNTYTGPSFQGAHRSNSGYFACLYNNPAYWRHMGWAEPAAFNHVVSYVYAASNPGNNDPGDVFYIRSTDSGVTFSAPSSSTATPTPPRRSGRRTCRSATQARSSPRGTTRRRAQTPVASRPAPPVPAIKCMHASQTMADDLVG